VRQFNGSVCLEKVQWQRLFLILAVLPALLALNSCGGSNSTTATPTMTISCAATSVVVNGTVQCTQNVLNLSSTLVNWEVSVGTGTPVAGGNSTLGTINTNGLYTAPAALPTAGNVVTITAVAQAQTTLTATATIQLNAATAISAVTCVDSTNTPNLTVASGMSLTCSATSSANTSIPVFWQVDTVTGGTLAVGQISTLGSYVAPLVPPANGTVTITAISQAVSTQTMSVTVNVVFGNRVLSGSYAFSTSGRVISGNTFYARAGSFIAGGNGTLTGNVEDYNQVGQTKANQLVFTGLYSIGPDGRGTMEFCENISTACTVGSATALFDIVVASPQHVQMIEFSQRVGSGEMDLQDTSVFNAGGLAGMYSFNFSGQSSTSIPQSEVGDFSANSGNISAGSIGTPPAPGRIDLNVGGTQSTLAIGASPYTISLNGRGTTTIGTSTFAFYLLSSSRAKFIETDTSVLTGDAVKQQTSTCSWGPNSLSGVVVLATAGTKASAGVTDLLSFKADGSSAISIGSVDENSGGVLAPTASSLTGTYTIDVCGRGTLSIPATAPNHTYVFYMTSVNGAVVQDDSSGVVAQGTMVQPTGQPQGGFTAAALSGSNALNLAGTFASGPAGNEAAVVGQLTMSGASTSASGTISAGTVDANNSATNTGATQTTTGEVGTYTVDTSATTTGRATMTLASPQNLVLYIISPTQAFAMVGTDNTGIVALGSLFKQF
jgi:hypothetical protein